MVATFTIVLNSEVGPFLKETRVQEPSLASPIKESLAIGGCHSGFAAHGHYAEWLLCQQDNPNQLLIKELYQKTVQMDWRMN